MRRIAVLAAMVSGFACGGSSSTQTFSASPMVQTNEPASFRLKAAPTATGSAQVQIVGNTLTYSLRGSNLTSAPSVAHIHLTPAGAGPAQGAVIVTFKVLNAGATASTNSITVDDVVTNPPDATAKNLDGTPMSFDQLVQHIKNGETYVNIHTGSNPSGEIRADLH
ncbi:MAG: CHRD domain-containing protein [Deltaproteobacteria bacterium]|nr:MAG: CHRD domain-containing protein [Deltaproteobacteria bacterium]